MGYSLDRNVYGILNPVITVISMIIIGILVSETVTSNLKNIVILGSVALGFLVGIIQVYRFYRMTSRIQPISTEEILEGQRKLVRELFKEDFEDEGI